MFCSPLRQEFLIAPPSPRRVFSSWGGVWECIKYVLTVASMASGHGGCAIAADLEAAAAAATSSAAYPAAVASVSDSRDSTSHLEGVVGPFRPEVPESLKRGEFGDELERANRVGIRAGMMNDSFSDMSTTCGLSDCFWTTYTPAPGRLHPTLIVRCVLLTSGEKRSTTL